MHEYCVSCRRRLQPQQAGDIVGRKSSRSAWSILRCQCVHDVAMPPDPRTVLGVEHYVFGLSVRPSVCPSVVPLTRIPRDTMSSLSARI